MQQRQEYWCHICKRQFTSFELSVCPNCQSEFCEVIDPQNDPRQFIPYGEQPRAQHIIHITTMRQQIQGNLFDNLLRTMFPMTNFHQGQSMDSLIEFISRNDPNRYGSPPAAKSAIDKLKVIRSPKDACTVCQEEYNDQDALEFPCQHHFHRDCIIPWLELHNSCPVCRHELPTDDEDYNKRKSLT